MQIRKLTLIVFFCISLLMTYKMFPKKHQRVLNGVKKSQVSSNYEHESSQSIEEKMELEQDSDTENLEQKVAINEANEHFSAQLPTLKISEAEFLELKGQKMEITEREIDLQIQQVSKEKIQDLMRDIDSMTFSSDQRVGLKLVQVEEDQFEKEISNITAEIEYKREDEIPLKLMKVSQKEFEKVMKEF